MLLLAAGCLSPGVAERRLMSFNVMHCEGADRKVDVARTAAAILRESPDFVGLQELDRGARKRSGGADQPAELGRITGMHATFAKAIPFQGGEYGVAVLSREKPISVFTAPLPGKEPRVLLLCEFGEFWFGTTHLSVAAESERIESIAIIRKAVAERARTKPVFLTGDWNANPDSPVLAGMRGFLKVLSDERGRTYHGFKENAPDGAHCIDYIAVDASAAQDVACLESHVVPDVTTSDHSPVVATVSLKRGKGAGACMCEGGQKEGKTCRGK